MLGKRQTRKKPKGKDLAQSKGGCSGNGQRSMRSKSDQSTVNLKSKLNGSHNHLSDQSHDMCSDYDSVQNTDKMKTKTCEMKEVKGKSKTLSEMYAYNKTKRTSVPTGKASRSLRESSETGAKLNNNKTKEKSKNAVGPDSQENDSFIQNLLIKGFEKSLKPLKTNVFTPPPDRSHNMVHYLQQMSFGIKSRLQLKESAKKPIVDMCKDFKPCRLASPFDRRVTAIEWHPTQDHIVAVGSKGGDIIIWNTLSVDKDKFVAGIGAAGSCQAVKFWPWDTSKVMSASINGTVTLHDFESRQGVVLADTMDSYDHWYCSVDVNSSRYMVAAGRNAGILHLMSSEGRKIFEYRLHKNKITHVEFSPREEWLLCTASTDQTVQFWDIRNMKDRKSTLAILKHDKPVNSAYFSRTDGCRLLTTDQKNEIRVYRAPEWRLETTISHPHRFFQHITPFKATWHPLLDVIVCGRYPDKEFPGYQDREPRTLDMFDAVSGDMVAKLYDPENDGLCPLNKFNNRGDALVSGMGFHIKLWNRKEVTDVLQEQIKNKLLGSELLQGLTNHQRASNNRSRSRASGNQGQGRNEDTDDLKKKKKRKMNGSVDTLTKVKTKSLKK